MSHLNRKQSHSDVTIQMVLTLMFSYGCFYAAEKYLKVNSAPSPKQRAFRPSFSSLVHTQLMRPQHRLHMLTHAHLPMRPHWSR